MSFYNQVYVSLNLPLHYKVQCFFFGYSDHYIYQAPLLLLSHRSAVSYLSPIQLHNYIISLFSWFWSFNFVDLVI